MLYELKDIRINSGMSRKEAAEKLNVPFNTYRNWEQCVNQPRDNEQIKQIANLFGVSIEALFGYDMIPPGALTPANVSDEDAFKYVPLLGRIAAGQPIYMDRVEDHVLIPNEVMRHHPHAFLLRVEGESMNRILPDGCFALIDPDLKEPTIDNAPYAVCVNGYDATIKRVHRLNHGFELVPDSTDPTFVPRVYDYNDPSTDLITVIGEVVWYTLPYDWSF